MKQDEVTTSVAPPADPVSFWLKLDLRLFAWAGGGHQARPWLLQLACWVARWSWVPLLLLMSSVLLRSVMSGLVLLVQCLLLAGVVQWAGKRLARRWRAKRPFMLGLSPNHLNHSERGGFPSAHAIVMGTVLGFMAPHLPNDAVVAGVGLIALATSWARVYAGAHFPLDVIVGMLAGVSVGSLAVTLQGL